MTRKFMDMNPKKWIKAIIGGYFVLSREAAFANADTIHIDLLKECNYQTVTLNKAYRYMKYVPPVKTEGNMAEIELYDEKGQKLAGTRIIPLVIEQEKMDAMQKAAGSEPILNVLPFHQKKFAVITTGSEVFKGRIEDKFTPILEAKLKEYGCEMTFHKVCDDDPAGITAAILEAKAAGCELIFTTGGMSVDPDDRTPLAIKNTGADIVTYGAPVLPGAMFLVSYLDGVPVCGLPGCVMYAKRTIFDLLLPRLLADDPITADDIARLGEGGLCLGCAECHWPNCGFGHC